MSTGTFRSILFAFLSAGLTVWAGAWDRFVKLPWVHPWFDDNAVACQASVLLFAVCFNIAAIVVGRPRAIVVEMLRVFHEERLGARSEIRVTVLKRYHHFLLKRLASAVAKRFGGNGFHCHFLRARHRCPAEPDKPRATYMPFHVGEGVAGICWLKMDRWVADELPDTATDLDKWYDTCEKMGIARKKAERLGSKCRTYACLPIYDPEDPTNLRGVLSLDSLEERAFSDPELKAAELLCSMLSHVPF